MFDKSPRAEGGPSKVLADDVPNGQLVPVSCVGEASLPERVPQALSPTSMQISPSPGSDKQPISNSNFENCPSLLL